MNYVLANLLLATRDPSAPFWEACAIAVVALLLALLVVPRFDGPDRPGAREGDETRAEAATPRR